MSHMSSNFGLVAKVGGCAVGGFLALSFYVAAFHQLQKAEGCSPRDGQELHQAFAMMPSVTLAHSVAGENGACAYGFEKK